jgi:hypothetical protein
MQVKLEFTGREITGFLELLKHKDFYGRSLTVTGGVSFFEDGF